MSKVIISHDVDHLGSYEHLLADWIVPKFIVRSTIDLVRQSIDCREYYWRLKETLLNRWEFAREVAAIDLSFNIKSTYFFAAGNGIGLFYKLESAYELAHDIVSLGHAVGIHGIARDSLANIVQEKNRFEQVLGLSCTGIRFHYLFPDDSILPILEAAGFIYDSSLRGNTSSKLVGQLRHFPVHIMDCDVFNNGKGYQSRSLSKAVQHTCDKISCLVDQDVDYISLLFHDRYFSRSHQAWKDWYCEILSWIVAQGLLTTTYESATLSISDHERVVI